MTRPSAPIALLLLLLAAQPASAKYWPHPLHQMAAAADLAVVGQITRLTPTHFQIAVEQVVLGQAGEAASLEVRRFRDFACARRYAPYAAGQRALWFLRRVQDKAGRAELYVVSGGNEGELPLHEGHAYYKGSLPAAPSKRGAHAIGKLTYNGHRLPLKALVAALRGFRAVFRVTTAGRWKDVKQLAMVDAAALQRYRKQSAIHELLAQAALRDRRFRK